MGGGVLPIFDPFPEPFFPQYLPLILGVLINVEVPNLHFLVGSWRGGGSPRGKKNFFAFLDDSDHV